MHFIIGFLAVALGFYSMYCALQAMRHTQRGVKLASFFEWHQYTPTGQRYIARCVVGLVLGMILVHLADHLASR